MAYVIEYDGQVQRRFLPHKKIHNNFKAAAIVFMILIIAVVWIVTPVRVAVLEFILPGNGAVTRRAARTMFLEMKGGQSFREAFSDFCVEIIENP